MAVGATGALQAVEALSASLLPQSYAQATVALEKRHSDPRYFVDLLAIIGERTHTSTPVRQAAAVQLKNGVDRYWRKTSANAIPPDIKADIRKRLLVLLDESCQPIGKLLILCIGKIARLDYDNEWITLPTDLLALISDFQTSKPQYIKQSLEAIKEVIKSLASNRMPRGRVATQQFCRTVLPLTSEIYIRSYNSGILESLLSDHVLELQIARISLKCLHFIFLYGDADVQNNVKREAFLLSTLEHFHQIRMRSGRLQTNNVNLLPASRLQMSYVKFWQAMATTSSANLLTPALSECLIDLCCEFLQEASYSIESISSDDKTAPNYEPMVAKILIILKSVITDWTVTPPHRRLDDRVHELTRLLVECFLLLRRRDLEAWMADPEGWAASDEFEYNDFEVRPCVGALLKSLADRYSTVGPLVLQLLQPLIVPVNSTATLLAKEAIYCAIGLCSSQIASHIDLEPWLDAHLLPEAIEIHPHSIVMRRRIAFLLGTLVGDECTSAARQKAYWLLIRLLSADIHSDITVRLAAARALQASIDAFWHFDEAEFQPHLEAAVLSLLALLFECSLPDSQARVSGALSAVIGRMPDRIAPFAPRLVQAVSEIWQLAGDHHLLRAAALDLMTLLVEAVGYSAEMQSVMVALVSTSCDPHGAFSVYLQEEGLELWIAVLRQGTVLDEPLRQLLPLLLRLIASGTDGLPKILVILESYCLLDGPYVLAAMGGELFASLQNLLGGLNSQATRALLQSLSLVIATAPCSIWLPALRTSSIFTHLLLPLQDVKQSTLTITHYLTMLARIVTQDVNAFLMFAEDAARANVSNWTEKEILALVLHHWLDKLDNFQVEQRKLVALALALLVGAGSAVFLERLEAIVAFWLVPLAEVEESIAGDSIYYRPKGEADENADISPDDGQVMQQRSADHVRRAEITRRDPIHSVRLADAIRAQLAVVETACGGAQQMFERYLSVTDPLVIEELYRRLRGELKG